MEKFYTAREAMEILSIKKSKYYELIKNKKLAFYQTADGQKRHTEQQLKEFLEYKEIEAIND